MRKGHLLRLPLHRSIAGATALIAAGLCAPAQAAGTIDTALAKAHVMRDAASGCAISPHPLSPASAPFSAGSKSAALLGGAVSALDVIKAQQTVPGPALSPFPTMLAGIATPRAALSPGIDASVSPAASCNRLVASRVAAQPGTLSPFAVVPPDPENFLASKRVRIGQTNFDKDWKRVSSDTLSVGQLRRHMGALPVARADALAAVNRWVNRRIRYAEDRDQYGVGDFWAGARKTLKSGKGDCEDIALVKMQLLAAAGIPRDDMILTIARDLVRNADHAVLVVRTDAGYRLLDNATDDVLDAAPGHDYRPILSFGNQTRWLHGV